MSGAAADMAPLTSLAARAWRVAAVVAMASLVVFVLAEDRLLASHVLQPGLRTFWNHPNDHVLLAAQWTLFVIVHALRVVPGSGPSSLTIVTILMTAAAQGLLARDLVRRGWEPSLAACGVLLTTVNPVALFVATSGSPVVFSMIGIGMVVIAIDRVEAIGDTRALILLGLAIAALFVFWPNAIYWVLPMLALLPLAFRDMRSLQAGLALFVITLLPACILVASIMLGVSLFELPPLQMMAAWAAILHSAPSHVAAGSAWLTGFGGRGYAAFATLAMFCLLVAPRGLLLLARLIGRHAERARPSTAIAALVLPPLSGALATQFWHLESPLPVIAYSIAAVAAWTATSSFRKGERWIWVGLSAAGTAIGWIAPILWHDAGMGHWRQIVLGA